MLKVGKNLMLLAPALSLTIGVVLAGVLFLSACGASTTTITPPPTTTTTTPPPTPTQRMENLTSQEAFALIQENQNNPDFVIIDVRTPEEFAGGHIENALILDYYSETFQDEIEVLDRNKMYLIYCDIGNRSGASLAIMEELGFLEVYNMLGGIIAWNAEELPVVTE